MTTYGYHRGPMAGAQIRAWFPSRLQSATGQAINMAEATRLLQSGRGFYSRKRRERLYYWSSMEGYVYPEWWPRPDGGDQ